jgi:CheY-like chemotaxis protein
VIEWRESGGPAVDPPTRTGFGSVLIDRSIRYDLGGDAAVEYAADGLRATFRIPAAFVTERVQSSRPDTRSPPAAEQAPPPVDLRGKQVLLVEDQLLIAMDLERILGEQGVGTIETAASVSEALRRLEGSAPDLAILDLNLGSETSAIVADELVRRGIPFAFATGYSDRAFIPERFDTAPIIRKPFDEASVIGQVERLLHPAPTAPSLPLR